MTQLTPEQLREFPLKDRWGSDEALALIEVVDGTECIHGVSLPYYAVSDADKVRWANCIRVASQASGFPVAHVVVQQSARTMFMDRATYTD